ncbi:MAG: Na+/H+ antiporter NhaC family protein, partial [Planctomycetota bacterium]
IRGVMDRIAALAKNARQTQVATWLMGLTIFFDDYANTILVGSTMRPLADRFRVAREKLAYIVDSTAAPVAGVSLLSTWIAFEVSTFSAQLPDAGLPASDGYAVFIQTLPFRFYCWLTLFFVGMNVFLGRDFGPMLKAEKRARSGKVLRDGATPLVGKAATEIEARDDIEPRAATALVPLAGFVLTGLGMIVWNGAVGVGILAPAEGFPGLRLDLGAGGGFLEAATGILFAGSGNTPLMVGAMAGFGVATLFALRRGLPGREILRASANSVRAMMIALVILYLAWMVGRTCSVLGTATYLAATLTNTIPYVVLPIALFLLAGVIAFSTGSSWSTMTILLPLVVGLSYEMGVNSTPAGVEGHVFGLSLMVICIGAVLEGAIFGDHCSPISDTTVMSSIACACDHIDHVRTQAPYAILTMSVALVVGYFPVTFLQVSPWISLAVGAAVLAAVLVLRGKRVGNAPAVAAEAG